MIINNQSNQLIRYANDFIASIDIVHINPYDTKWYQDITKARKAYKKRFKHDKFNDAQVDCGESLREFAIPFSAIPNELFSLMESMRWIQHDSKEPLISTDMFYCNKWHDASNRGTIIEWHIDFDKYVDLLLINDDLRSWYLSEVA